jgi:hypothetical protein
MPVVISGVVTAAGRVAARRHTHAHRSGASGWHSEVSVFSFPPTFFLCKTQTVS